MTIIFVLQLILKSDFDTQFSFILNYNIICFDDITYLEWCKRILKYISHHITNHNKTFYRECDAQRLFAWSIVYIPKPNPCSLSTTPPSHLCSRFTIRFPPDPSSLPPATIPVRTTPVRTTPPSSAVSHCVWDLVTSDWNVCVPSWPVSSEVKHLGSMVSAFRVAEQQSHSNQSIAPSLGAGRCWLGRFWSCLRPQDGAALVYE